MKRHSKTQGRNRVSAGSPTPSEYVRKGLVNQGSDACMRHLLRHSAAVVNSVRVVGVNRQTGQRGDSEVSGSGCPMRWGRHHFVLTAAHVFENAEARDLRVLTFADLPLNYKSREALTKRDIVDGTPLTDSSVIHRCDWEDLAVVTIDPGQFPGVDFTEPDMDWIDPAVGEDVNCCGFPSDHSVIVSQRTVTDGRVEADLAVWPTTFGGSVTPFPSGDEVKFYYDGLDPDRHYVIPYDGAGVSEHPGGISGAAVWWESDEKLLIWRPNFKFAGTCTHCHKQGTRVRVVKASMVRRFLVELFGDPSVTRGSGMERPQTKKKKQKKLTTGIRPDGSHDAGSIPTVRTPRKPGGRKTRRPARRRGGRT
jgi:hypothetical protein